MNHDTAVFQINSISHVTMTNMTAMTITAACHFRREVAKL